MSEEKKQADQPATLADEVIRTVITYRAGDSAPTITEALGALEFARLEIYRQSVINRMIPPETKEK